MLEKETSVGGLVFSERNKDVCVLIFKQSKEGSWEIPKGHTEEGETHTQTLKREIQEETGIEKFRLLSKEPKTISWKRKSKNVIRELIYYPLITHVDDITVCEEHSEYKWIKETEIHSYFSYDDIKDIIRWGFSLVKKQSEEIEESQLNVIIPCRNVSSTIEKTILSIKDEVLNTNGRIICVENACTDNTNEILRKMSNLLPMTVEHIQSEPGKITAILAATKLLKETEPFVCIDADVVCRYKNISLLIEELRKHPILVTTGGVPNLLKHEVRKEQMVFNLSGLFPKTKITKDSRYGFLIAAQDPQDEISPTKEIRHRPFFHGRIYAVRNKMVLPKEIPKNNVADDVFWNRYFFHEYGPSTIRILHGVQASYIPFSSKEELFSYRRRIKAQVNEIEKLHPEFIELRDAFTIYRDMSIIKNLSNYTRMLFSIEEKMTKGKIDSLTNIPYRTNEGDISW